MKPFPLTDEEAALLISLLEQERGEIPALIRHSSRTVGVKESLEARRGVVDRILAKLRA